MNYFNLIKRKYKNWLSEETSPILKTGRLNAVIPSPARDICLRKFASMLYSFPPEQIVICWQMAKIIPKPAIQDQNARQLQAELEARETECHYDVPLEGHLLAQNFVDPPVDLPKTDDHQDIYREYTEDPPARSSQQEEASQ